MNELREGGPAHADLAAPATVLPAASDASSSLVASDRQDVPSRVDRRLRAVSSYLVGHPPSLLPFAAQLRELEAVFESSIRGPSMEPAIPSLSRIRVQLLEQPCRRGDVVFFLADDGGYMVHRVVYRAHRAPEAGYLLTCGDYCVTPDPPLRDAQVLGTVIAVQTPDGWRPPGPLRVGPLYKRVLRSVSLTAMIAALRVSAPAARDLAVWLLEVECFGRRAVRRLRRRWRLRQRAH